AANALIPAPPNCSAQIAQAALSIGSAMTKTKGAAIIMATTKSKLAGAAVVAILFAGAAVPIVYHVARQNDPESAQRSATPTVTRSPVAQTVTDRMSYQPGATDSKWQDPFNSAYRLGPGQSIQRVIPQFIPQ